MPIEMKLANDCTCCLTAFIKSRAVQELGAGSDEGAMVNAPSTNDRLRRSDEEIGNTRFQKFGDYGIEDERLAAITALDSMLAARKARLKFFESDLFFDPTWAMLLDLYRSDLTGAELSVSSLCIGSGVPSTTALRYLQLIEERGYVERSADKSDKRRTFVRLTSKGRGAMSSYIELTHRNGKTAISRRSFETAR